MAGYNRVILVGNLTRDPEVRYIPSGTAVSDLGLAVNQRVKKGNDWVDETTFLDVTVWGRRAEVIGEYLSKGSPVFVEGHLRVDKWEKDGQKHSRLRITADRVEFMSSKGGERSGGGSSRPAREDDPFSAPAEEYIPSGPPDDDIPF